MNSIYYIYTTSVGCPCSLSLLVSQPSVTQVHAPSASYMNMKMNANSTTPPAPGPAYDLRSRPLAAEKSFAAGDDMNALRPKPGNNLLESQPPTPERKRLQYPAEASPTTGERRENLVDELFTLS